MKVPPLHAIVADGFPLAVEKESQALLLWAESPEEARNFLKRMQSAGNQLKIERIFVAKRNPKSRSNTYVGGHYHPTSDDKSVDVFDSVVASPPKITDLVQWCTCDIMLSRGWEPLVVMEDTTHIVRMDLYQRMPRLARAAIRGVPSLVLQGTRGLDFRLRGDRWALHRYLSTFEAIARLHPSAPARFPSITTQP